jgi:hypothetical protein
VYRCTVCRKLFERKTQDSPLRRGLIGHLLNGCDTRFVKTDMRKTSRTPKPAMTEPLSGFATPAE